MPELKLGELKALIREYNKVMQKDQGITPAQLKGKSREELIKIINDLGYTIDHEKRSMKRTKVGQKDKKKRPMVVELPAPKTEEEKKTAKEERVKKKEEKTKKETAKKKEAEEEGFKKGAAAQRIATQLKKKKKAKTSEAGTQTEEDKEMSDKDLLKHYGHYKVG